MSYTMNSFLSYTALLVSLELVIVWYFPLLDFFFFLCLCPCFNPNSPLDDYVEVLSLCLDTSVLSSEAVSPRAFLPAPPGYPLFLVHSSQLVILLVSFPLIPSFLYSLLVLNLLPWLGKAHPPVVLWDCVGGTLSIIV